MLIQKSAHCGVVVRRRKGCPRKPKMQVSANVNEKAARRLEGAADGAPLVLGGSWFLWNGAQTKVIKLPCDHEIFLPNLFAQTLFEPRSVLFRQAIRGRS